jgi:ATP-binding protein involved in chromosome partitioning
MFKTVNVPVRQTLVCADLLKHSNSSDQILGVVENMSYFECPFGQQFDIFGRGGAKKTAETMGADFLGEIPIVKEIREYSDQGKPITVALPDSSTAKSYRLIAQQVIQKLESLKAQSTGPTIIME